MPSRNPDGRRLSGAQQRKAAAAAESSEESDKLVAALQGLLDELGPAPANAAMAADWLLRAQVGLGTIVLRFGCSPRCHQASQMWDKAAKVVDAAKLRVELDELLARLSEGANDGSPLDGGKARAGEEAARH